MIDDLLRALFRYAWPKPSVDRLLRAALLDDPSAAGAAWREYEAAADFDRLTAVEVRLLGLVSRRLEALAPDSPMRARIGGIERANWSRSQLAIGEARSGLHALEAERVNMLAIEGTGRIAADGAWLDLDPQNTDLRAIQQHGPCDTWVLGWNGFWSLGRGYQAK